MLLTSNWNPNVMRMFAFQVPRWYLYLTITLQVVCF